jgi:Hypothetical protein FLILHELTA
VLHELTAIIPLVGLATIFHYSNWLPSSVVEGEWVKQGVEKWGRYFKRKGWVESDGESPAFANQDLHQAESSDHDQSITATVESRGKGWRVVLEVATAWAIVKALMPVRIIGCVWASPWFARVAVLPITRIFGRIGRKS